MNLLVDQFLCLALFIACWLTIVKLPIGKILSYEPLLDICHSHVQISFVLFLLAMHLCYETHLKISLTLPRKVGKGTVIHNIFHEKNLVC